MFASCVAAGILGMAFAAANTPSVAELPEYAFFEQWTVTPAKPGQTNSFPCMARLSDGRVLLAWAFAPAGTEYRVVARVSTDCGCSWRPVGELIQNEDAMDVDPSILVSGDRVFVTSTTVKNDGINTSATWCARSEDNCKTWAAPSLIPMNHRYTCGKTHRGLRLQSGTLLMGYSWDTSLEKGGTLEREGEMDLRASVMRSTDNGDTWTNGGDTHATYERVSDGAVLGTDEPALVELADGSLYMLMRTGSDHLYEARSRDEGLTWEGVRPSPLYGSNAPAALARFEHEGRGGVLVVWNNSLTRKPLCAAASFDGGQTWSAPKDLAAPYTGQASYPSCLQATDGTLLAVWQQDTSRGRVVRLARFSIDWLLEDEPAPEQDTSQKETAAPITIVTFGDSTTATRGPLRIFARLLAEELPAEGLPVRVVNAGVGGSTTAMARARFEVDVLAHKPDLVTIGFGINDSAVDVWKGATESRVSLTKYQANLRYFVHTLRAQGASVILLTPNRLAWTEPLKEMYGKPPYDPVDPDGFNVVLKRYAEAVRRIAESEDIPLVDSYALFDDLAAKGLLDRVLLDGMHPNDLGHRLLCNRLKPLINELASRPEE